MTLSLNFLFQEFIQFTQVFIQDYFDYTVDIFTTSHVEKVNPNNNRKNLRPKEHFCSEGRIEKVKCQTQSADACKFYDPATQVPVCAFDQLGVKFDFKRECEACENDSIKYYFKSTCPKIPKICTKTQECVNGVCVLLLNESQDDDRIVCNEQEDCPSKAELCVANKCIDKRELIGKLSKAEKTHPQLAEKNAKARNQAKKFENERRKKDLVEIEQLKVQIRAIKQKKKIKTKQTKQEKQQYQAPKPQSNLIE